jgi:uncharacterized BrkB/YihY/UPF0761 family membrane protein
LNRNALPLPLSKPVRAYCKIAAVAGALGILLGVVITFVSREAVNDLRHHLTLGLVLAMAAVINVASFALFGGFWALYRWIKRDLEPPEDA